MSSDSRLPSLKALQVLECVARTRSFKDAANELFVTPAAVSFQIRQLEKDLGSKLFERTQNGIIPTEACEAFIPKLTVGIETIHEAFKAFLSSLDDTHQPIRITSGPAVMSKWLVPAVHNLKQQNPNIEIEFSAGVHIVDLLRDNIDFAIRFGAKPEGYVKLELAEEYLVPAVNPGLADQVRCPEDLLKFDLIHDGSLHLFDAKAPDWETWFEHVGLDYDKQRKGLSFSQSDHAVQAALSGAGVGLLRVILAGPELISGNLLAPFGPAIPTGLHYYLLSQTEEPQTAEAEVVLNWLEHDIGHMYEQLIEMAQSLSEMGKKKRTSSECFRTLKN